MGELPVSPAHQDIVARPFAGFPFPHPTWCGRASWFRTNPVRFPGSDMPKIRICCCAAFVTAGLPRSMPSAWLSPGSADIEGASSWTRDVYGIAVARWARKGDILAPPLALQPTSSEVRCTLRQSVSDLIGQCSGAGWAVSPASAPTWRELQCDRRPCVRGLHLMCGIAGLLRPGGDNESCLQAPPAAWRKRSLIGTGHKRHLDRCAGRIAFGHRRISISTLLTPAPSRCTAIAGVSPSPSTAGPIAPLIFAPNSRRYPLPERARTFRYRNAALCHQAMGRGQRCGVFPACLRSHCGTRRAARSH